MASRLWGDWNRLRLLTTRMRNLVDKERLQESLDAIGEEILQKVVDNIINSELDLAPLADSYEKRKGDTLPILIRTGEWVDKLRVETVEATTEKITIFIGGTDEVLDGGLTVAELTYYIEEGTINQPARPVFLLTWLEIRDEMKVKIIEALGKEILNNTLNIKFT